MMCAAERAKLSKVIRTASVYTQCCHGIVNK